ncbi:FkbM family methyltransferase [Pseudoalteromonas xiamenensis]
MSDFYLAVLRELNKVAEQPLFSGCTNQFRTKVSNRLRLINFFQVTSRVATAVFKILTKNYLRSYKPKVILLDNSNYFVNNIEKFEYAYNFMEDESKQKYINYIAFNYLKNYSLRLPFDNDAFFSFVDKAKRAEPLAGSDMVEINSDIGRVIIPYDVIGYVINYDLEQYAFGEWLKVSKGDVVLDCGAANGDTALYFALNGAKKVYSFEFLRENVEKFNNVMSANSHQANVIELVESALWSRSGIELTFKNDGNASSVSEENLGSSNAIKTISIDDFIRERQSGVDFIKMDIEGAELKALEGASEVIQRYKPKLAICVYHKDTDLVDIPRLILSLCNEYRFNFDYYTDTGAEAVLYAKVVSSK